MYIYSQKNQQQNQTFDESPFIKKQFINFTTDLSMVSNPLKYNILNYETVEYLNNGKYCRIVDSSNWISSPPPEFHVIASPASTSIRPGESKDIRVTVTGDTDLQAITNLSVENYKDRNDKNVSANFLSNNITVSSFSNGSSILHINSTNLDSKFTKYYRIPIIGKISFPPELINNTGGIYANNNTENIIERSEIILTLLPSLTPLQQLQEFAETLKPIGELWYIFAPIGTAIITFVLYLYKKRNENNNKIDTTKQNISYDNKGVQDKNDDKKFSLGSPIE